MNLLGENVIKKEKIKMKKKGNHLVERIATTKGKYIVGTCLLSGIGVALPRIFHVLAGSSAGATFLPMHLAVLIAALTFGALSASIVAGSSVIFSYLLTGMPTLVRLPYLLIELVIYATLLSIFHKKWNTYLAFIATIILGRILYSVVLFVAINVFGLPTDGISVIQSAIQGFPGMVLQLICVPPIAQFIRKEINLNE